MSTALVDAPASPSPNTPSYPATEYSKGVDYWALGILLFEMVTGNSPFADMRKNDPMEIYKNILRGNFRFTSACSNPQVCVLLTSV